MPETSIVIRTYNEEKHLGNLLQAVKKQDYQNYEIVVVDSGSSDKTLEIAQEHNARIFKIESRDFTFGYSLNIGCKEAKGEYIVIVSAHVLPTDKKWLSHLLEPFKKDSKVAMVYGRQVGYDTSKFSEKRDFKRLFSDQPINKGVPFIFANNANSAIRKDLWEKKSFDARLFGLEDIEWAKYYREKKYEISYAPKAAIYHIHNEKWHQIYNRYRREAIAAQRIGLEHPPQVKLDPFSLILNLFLDTLTSFPNWSPSRLEEILRFRYYQWKGSRQGWYRDRYLDMKKDAEELYFPLPMNESVVIESKGKASVQHVPIPEMRPGDILIQVGYVGICRTDLEVYEGTLGYYKDGIATYPIVPGHEFSGTIVRVGANNKFRERFKVGDKVIGECVLSRGETSERKEVGVVNHNGAYSKYVIVPGTAIHQLPHDYDLKIAALAEPLAVVLRALRRVRSRLVPGSNIAVVGAGPIGNFAAQVLSLENHKVTVFDKRKDRLEFLKNKVHKTATEISDLKKFNLIIEATGSADALSVVLQESALDTTLLLLGFPYANINYNFEDVVGFEKVIVGSVGAQSEDFPKALELLPKLDMKPFLDAIIPLNNFEKAWEQLRTGKHLKIILKP